VKTKRNKMKVGDYVKAPEGCETYLTAGKKYKVLWTNDENSAYYGFGFNIIADNGNEILCLERNCSHLNGGNWIKVVPHNDDEREFVIDGLLITARCRYEEGDEEVGQYAGWRIDVRSIEFIFDDNPHIDRVEIINTLSSKQMDSVIDLIREELGR
jgi:hypothetical protein